MKICRVFPNFQTDLQYAEHYLAKELSLLGHTTTFITSDKYLKSWNRYVKTKDKTGYRKFEHFDVYRLSAFFPFEKVIFKNWVLFYKHIFRSHYDVIHLLGVGTFTTLITLLLSYFCKSSNLPLIIVSDHTDARTSAKDGRLADFYHVFFKWMYKLFGHRIKWVVSFGEAGAAVLKKRYKIQNEKIRIIPLGFDSDNYKYIPELKNKEDNLVIGFAGKIDEKKRVDFLLKAIDKSKNKDSIRLIIVGAEDGLPYIEYLKKLAKDFKLSVEFRPFASSAELCKFYNFIDLAIYPGGISITTIEANGCGTPVVIYRSIEGLECRVENNRGFLFSTSEELVEHINSFFSAGEKISINYQSIADVTASSTSWKSISNDYLKIYQNNRHD
jgi:glycosyltransferase involved in cell wall biosynthesis